MPYSVFSFFPEQSPPLQTTVQQHPKQAIEQLCILGIRSVDIISTKIRSTEIGSIGIRSMKIIRVGISLIAIIQKVAIIKINKPTRMVDLKLF